MNSTLFVESWVGRPWPARQFPAILERLQESEKLKGLRHVIQDEPDDDFMHRPDFNAGVALLKQYGLVYDILIFERHLPAAISFVDRHPAQVFVLDHIAKPRIRDRELEPWRTNIRELARRENVYCKVSGMVTEANWKNWSPSGPATLFRCRPASLRPQAIDGRFGLACLPSGDDLSSLVFHG